MTEDGREPVDEVRVAELVNELAQAEERDRAAWEGGGLGDLERQALREAARAEVLRLERELADARGEPYAVPCDFPVAWCSGAPCPLLLVDEFKAHLTFNRAFEEGREDERCLVTFHGCTSAKLGAPNDEALGGHPLSGRGLEYYSAHEVVRSPWIAEILEINRVHPLHKDAHYDGLKHYVFCFHDTTFECLAESFEVKRNASALERVLRELQSAAVPPSGGVSRTQPAGGGDRSERRRRDHWFFSRWRR